MKYSAFIKKYIGKKLDFDGMYDCQCVDLIDYYMTDVLGLKLNLNKTLENGGAGGNAKYFWLSRYKSAFLKLNFDFIDPYKKDIKTGDIGIRATGKNGHIYIIDNYNRVTNELVIYDTNGKGNNDAMTKRITTVNSAVITGILRPKKRDNIDKAMTSKFYIESPCSLFNTNAVITKDASVYSDNEHQNKIGTVFQNEKVKLLASGKTNTIIQYGVSKNVYKVGLILTKNIKIL